VRESNNIFLVGLMGAGKTTVGRILARELHKTFVDTDREIEKRTGVAIPVIFEFEGEAGFRAREAVVIGEFVHHDQVVLATGGGAVLQPENRTLLAANGRVVYLHAQPHDLFQRTRRDRNRPLLQTADPQAKLAELYGARDPLYREIADVVVDTGRQSAGRLASILISMLEAP
jgi:shikimate kinase